MVCILDGPLWSVFDILGPSDKHHLYVRYKVLFHTGSTFFNSLADKWEQEKTTHGKVEKAHHKAESDLKMTIANLNERK